MGSRNRELASPVLGTQTSEPARRLSKPVEESTHLKLSCELPVVRRERRLVNGIGRRKVDLSH